MDKINDENTSKEKNKKIIIIALLAFVLLLVGFLSGVAFDAKLVKNNKNNDEYYKLQMQEILEEKEKLEKEKKLEEEKKKTENKEEYHLTEEEIKRMEEEEAKRKEERNNKTNAISENLLNKGFNEINDCSNESLGIRCFTKGDLMLEVSWTGIDFEKITKIGDPSKYDSRADLEIIGSVYDISFSDDDIKTMNKLIGNMFELSFSNIKISIKGKVIEVEWSYDELRFSLKDGGRIIKDLVPNYIITDTYNPEKSSMKLLNLRRKLFYDVIMNDNNKEYYNFYDFAYHYYENNNYNVCSIKYVNKNNYNFSSNYCKKNSTYAKFELIYVPDYQDYDSITVEIEENSFKDKYATYIENDLDYFSKKLGTNYMLDDNDYTKINKFFNNNKDKLSLNISNNLIIEIEYNENGYPDKLYKITYKL